jgi:hypothetical protein
VAATVDLEPRDCDDGLKSSWAHCLDDGAAVQMLVDTAQAHRKLQALNMWLHASARVTRSAVDVVSLHRDKLPASAVTDDRDKHLIRRFDATHRSLSLEPAQRAAIVKTAAWREIRSYSKAELAPLLDELLSAGLVRRELRALAKRLLDDIKASAG